MAELSTLSRLHQQCNYIAFWKAVWCERMWETKNDVGCDLDDPQQLHVFLHTSPSDPKRHRNQKRKIRDGESSSGNGESCSSDLGKLILLLVAFVQTDKRHAITKIRYMLNANNSSPSSRESMFDASVLRCATVQVRSNTRPFAQWSLILAHLWHCKFNIAYIIYIYIYIYYTVYIA